MKQSALIIFAMAALIISSCDFDNRWEIRSTEMRDTQSPFSGKGNFTFCVDRVADDPTVIFPLDTLYESQYTPVKNSKQYLIRLTDNKISIQNDSISGQLAMKANQMIKHNLSGGLFAGGRFIIWFNGRYIEAEFTMYGSGVLSSEVNGEPCLII
jgi:hypothetical protein